MSSFPVAFAPGRPGRIRAGPLAAIWPLGQGRDWSSSLASDLSRSRDAAGGIPGSAAHLWEHAVVGAARRPKIRGGSACALGRGISIVKSGVEYCDRASARAWLLAPLLRCTARPLADRWPFAPRWLRLLRTLFDARTAVLRARRGTLVQPIVYERFAAEWVDASPVTVTRDRAVLYLHGGGFVVGSPRSHRGLVSRLSENAGGPILSVDYRHPPEAPVETAIGDCVSAYEWLLRQGWGPDQIVVAGDGAGGNLAFTTVQRLRDLEKPVPAGLVAMSGWFDLTLATDTIIDNERSDPLMSLSFANRCVESCVTGGDDGGGVEAGDPWLSPVFARPDGLPPVLLQVGAEERLRGDSELMAERLLKAAVPCRLQLWRRQVHGFQALAGWLPDATRALAEVGAFVRLVTAGARRDQPVG